MGTDLSPAEKKAIVAVQPAPAEKQEKPPCDHTGYTQILHGSAKQKGDLPTITGRCMRCGAVAELIALDGSVVTKWGPPPAPPEAA